MGPPRSEGLSAYGTNCAAFSEGEANSDTATLLITRQQDQVM